MLLLAVLLNRQGHIAAQARGEAFTALCPREPQDAPEGQRPQAGTIGKSSAVERHAYRESMGSPERLALGGLARKACKKIQAENLLPARCIGPLPARQRQTSAQLAEGRASVHPPLPDSGWVSRRMDGPGDAEPAIELFRMNYGRAQARAKRRAASESTGR
jgi:hypothetical protein